VRRFVLKTDPMENDPGRWGHSLANLAEIWLALLDAARPASVVEVGAYAGDTTRILLDWAKASRARIVAIDPDPQPRLADLARDPALELIRATSHEALMALEPPDAVILDGDHNYYTVSAELRLIAERSNGFPLVICHDASWPHGRRDAYYAIEQIPEADRQPTVELGHLFPGDPGIHDSGLIFYHHRLATREGGPRNGVLTAIEDFVHSREELELVVVPAFFGLAVVWSRNAPWARDVASLLSPLADNPVVERLEANRVLNLARWEAERARVDGQHHDREWLQEHWNASSELLGRLLASRTFAVAIWMSRLRHGGRPAYSKAEIRRVLDR
jgi:hypothetical protein